MEKMKHKFVKMQKDAAGPRSAAVRQHPGFDGIVFEISGFLKA
jgi:hypothetical protein